MRPRSKFLPVLVALGVLGISGPAPARENPGNRNPVSELADQIAAVHQGSLDYLVRVVRGVDPRPDGRGRRIIGTGVSLGDGYVVTSAGVVGGGETVELVTPSGERFTARVVGVDRRTNVAVVHEPALDLPAVPEISSSLVFPGDLVVAVALGPLSAPDATFGTVILSDGPNLGFSVNDMIQVTAPAYAGYTGGVLLDQEGRMIGLISGRLALDGATATVPEGRDIVAGYLDEGHLSTNVTETTTVALPAFRAMEIARELIELGHVRRGYLGLQVELTGNRTTADYRSRGVRVHRVVEGGPAAMAGILPGDLILGYSGAQVQNAEDLSYLVGATLPESTVEIRFLRRGRRVTTPVHITSAPEEPWRPEMDQAYMVHDLPARVAPPGR